MQRSAVQCSAVQCSAVQCSAVQCSAVQCSAVQCSADKFIAEQSKVNQKGEDGTRMSLSDGRKKIGWNRGGIG
jgi:hypothetical protein